MASNNTTQTSKTTSTTRGVCQFQFSNHHPPCNRCSESNKASTYLIKCACCISIQVSGSFCAGEVTPCTASHTELLRLRKASPTHNTLRHTKRPRWYQNIRLLHVDPSAHIAQIHDLQGQTSMLINPPYP